MHSSKCLPITCSLRGRGKSTTIASLSRHAFVSRFANQKRGRIGSELLVTRFTSSLSESAVEFHEDDVVPYEDTRSTGFSRSSIGDHPDEAFFPGSKPVLLNAKVHAVGYLSKILNARVYEAAIETELQFATNLSTVSSAVPYFNLRKAFISDVSASLHKST
jgi:hypothetical protein